MCILMLAIFSFPQLQRRLPVHDDDPGRRPRLLGPVILQRHHGQGHGQAWLPDGYSKISSFYVFGPLGLKDSGCKI